MPLRSSRHLLRSASLLVFTLCVLSLAGSLPAAAEPAAAPPRCCVWKVTRGDRTLYLAGSVHALRKVDYPLPAPYWEALRNSGEVVFETDLTADEARWEREMGRAALLPKGERLQDKLDPRTYAYIQRVLAGLKGSTEPEKRIQRLRPWALSMMLTSNTRVEGISTAYGVEGAILAKARRDGKRTSGLVPLREHAAVFGGMSDADNELCLLLGFLHLDTDSRQFQKTVTAWKRGDTATIDAQIRGEYRDAPSLYRRIITERNRRWLPKIEGFLQQGPTRMVLVGAAHTAGAEGLPTLLAAKGYQVEQL